jgi:hypothetical protein
VRARAALLAAALVAGAGCGDEAPPRDMSRADVARVLSGLHIQPGLWETRSAVVDAAGPNLPVEARQRMIGPRPTGRHCIGAADAARPDAHFLATPAGRGCVYRGFALADGHLVGTTICPGPTGPATTRMDGQYRPARYAARMEIANPMPDGAILVVTVDSAGQRIGDCADTQAGPA